MGGDEVKMSSIPLIDPCSILVSGATGSGKTTFVSKLLSQHVFENVPEHIFYCYSTYQEAFDRMTADNESMIFHKGLPTEDAINSVCALKGHKLIILDDLMASLMNSPSIQELVTVKSHHCNASVIIIVQNAFQQGKFCRSISLNCHYLILLKNLRDLGQIALIGRQLFGAGKGKGFQQIYEDCMKQNFGYLLVDLSPRSKDLYRLRSHILPGEETVVYRLK